MTLRISPSTHHARVLICDADSHACRALAAAVRQSGHECVTCATPAEASEILSNPDCGIDVTVIDPATADGGETERVLKNIERTCAGCAVIVMTSYGAVEGAVSALRFGAADYLVKPIVDEEFTQSLTRAIARRELLKDNRTLRSALGRQHAMASIVGADPRMQKVYDMVGQVAHSRATVLMTGESGTGKSLIAHEIHKQSDRRAKAFVEISCGSIPETLLESELFGHVKGAFTGAHADKVGRFEAADGGTLFLDEINSASPAMQLKLLRVLQERKFEPVGSSRTKEVDVRVILASNQPLEALVAAGQFRQDLYYRINVVNVQLPPLRDRKGDVPLLANRFLERHAAELQKQFVGFAPEAMDLLKSYDYPGNVRELSNIVERAAVLAKRPTIMPEDLPDHVLATRSVVRQSEGAPWTPMTLDAALVEPERRILVAALDANGWNRQKTAEVLGINRATLYKKMRAHGMLEDRRLAG